MSIRVGISEDMGLRRSMEDEHALYDLPDKKFFSAEVYDGHGGRRAAQVAAEMLTPLFRDSLEKELEKPPRDRRPERHLLRESYLAVDAHLVASHIDSGTTAATFYILDGRFVAANAGDTRIVIGRKGGPYALTVDHRPDRPEEEARIVALGGEVVVINVPRVQGILAISRALGDSPLKPYVTAEPRIVEGWLGRENNWVVLACDGVWDVLSPEEVLTLVRSAGNAQSAAEVIKNNALDKGSMDNITVLVLDLREYTRGLERDRMQILAILDKAVP
jgi:serine/threonine protein phosphatase PrpC